MNLRQQLITVADSYAAARKISRATVSTLALNGGHVLGRIAERDGDLTTGSFEKALRWFSAHWPEGAEWPEGIARPPKDVVAA